MSKAQKEIWTLTLKVQSLVEVLGKSCRLCVDYYSLCISQSHASRLQLAASSRRSDRNICLNQASLYDDQHPYSLSYDIDLCILGTTVQGYDGTLIIMEHLQKVTTFCEVCSARYVAFTLRHEPAVGCERGASAEIVTTQ